MSVRPAPPPVTQDEVIAALDALRGLHALVIGETILDEYVYCDAIGKSGKEPVMVSRYVSSECQAGGVLAIANHLSELCQSVELVSALGAEDTREDFVRSRLAANVSAHFIYKQGSPTIVKRRYVDAYSLAKMMGVYHLNPAPLGADDETALLELLGCAIDRVDLVIVADYGHGLITPRIVTELSERAPFLAVNTQMNAANHGYHTLSKYPRLDYACLHEGELRLDARDLNSELRGLVEQTAERVGARAVTVTRGRKGSLLFERGVGFFDCPALTTKVVERVGAGDAVLAVTSLAVSAGIPSPLVGVLGNLAGAQQVSVVGNKSFVRRELLLERIRELFPTAPKRRRALG